ncbi:hypothetical protein QZH41_005492 [Actinostola sp. cb2023]|nr:hypothetical protein QZH41_005492 [Actinostola sp. cb2023]
MVGDIISKEESQRMAIDNMTDKELMEAGKAFDLKSLHYEEPNEDDESDDEDTLKAEADIVKQAGAVKDRYVAVAYSSEKMFYLGKVISSLYGSDILEITFLKKYARGLIETEMTLSVNSSS